VRAAVRVLDSYSLISYIEGEAGKDMIIDVFARPAIQEKHVYCQW
jgi:hypothetical protein